MSVLGNRLKEEREKRGWSQVFVAKKLGLKRSSTYANWEYGIREPDVETIKALADLFELSPNYLTGYMDKVEEEKAKYEVLTKEELIRREKEKLADMIIKLPENKRKLVEDLIRTLQDQDK